MQTILVPTDFSENSALALQYAVQIARNSGFNIRLIHIYELPLFERFLNDEVVRTIPEAQQDSLFRSFIDTAVSGSGGDDEVDIRWKVREGNIATEIERYVKEIDPLMVIMGSQGSGSDQWDQLIVGGTAQKIVRKLIIPIMLVPPDAEYRPIRRIAYATDFNQEDYQIIDELLGFAKNFNAEVIAVHVQEDKWDVHESKMEHLRSRFEDQLASGALRLEIIRHDDVQAGLDQFVQENDISLLGLLKRFHNLWDRITDRSFALKIAMSAHVPSIVFKET